jgi:hypothetical protein
MKLMHTFEKKKLGLDQHTKAHFFSFIYLVIICLKFKQKQLCTNVIYVFVHIATFSQSWNVIEMMW